MNIYQIVYNSSAATLNGNSGFGVRTASTGTPQEYIDLVNNNASLRSYNSGKFNISSDTILNSPEKIFEYPRGYYYRTVQVKGKQVYVIGRIVSTCFDHTFYITGKATRPGNYIAHIFIFDEFPGKKVFNLLTDVAQDEELFFIPRNWIPIQSNSELLALMVGKPQPLPSINQKLPEPILKWSKKSLDLLFSYRAALKEQKPIIVSLKDAITAQTVAIFMSFLPESISQETTFIINHQAEGHSKDVKISFINEYYQYTIYSNLCSHINLIDNQRPIDKLEEIWRPILEQALNDNNHSLAHLLINWIFSKMAEDNIDAPVILNEALFNYCQNPQKFTLNTINETDNILEVINKYTKQGVITSKHLNTLIIQTVETAAELKDFSNAINYCERINNAGLDISTAQTYIKSKFTDYLISNPAILYESLALLKDIILRKYSITEKYPKLYTILPYILEKQTDLQQISIFTKYIETNADIRVKTYINLLNQSPKMINQYSSLLNFDIEEAEKIDYISFFKMHLNNDEFAPLFYHQIKRESNMNSPLELLGKIYNLTKINSRFTKLILNDDQLFYTIYNVTKRQLCKENYDKTRKAIAENIFPLLSIESKARKQWQLLYEILNLRLPEVKNKILPFYNLAKDIMHIEALKRIVPMCFGVLETKQIDEFLRLIKQHELMTDSDIINNVLSNKDIPHLSYLLSVARLYKYDYVQIYEIVSKCKTNEKTKKRIIKSNFPELYKEHQKDTFIAKIKSIFNHKKAKE